MPETSLNTGQRLNQALVKAKPDYSQLSREISSTINSIINPETSEIDTIDISDLQTRQETGIDWIRNDNTMLVSMCAGDSKDEQKQNLRDVFEAVDGYYLELTAALIFPEHPQYRESLATIMLVEGVRALRPEATLGNLLNLANLESKNTIGWQNDVINAFPLVSGENSLLIRALTIMDYLNAKNQGTDQLLVTDYLTALRQNDPTLALEAGEGDMEKKDSDTLLKDEVGQTVRSTTSGSEPEVIEEPKEEKPVTPRTPKIGGRW